MTCSIRRNLPATNCLNFKALLRKWSLFGSEQTGQLEAQLGKKLSRPRISLASCSEIARKDSLMEPSVEFINAEVGHLVKAYAWRGFSSQAGERDRESQAEPLLCPLSSLQAQECQTLARSKTTRPRVVFLF